MRIAPFVCLCCAVLFGSRVATADQITAMNMDPGFVSTGWATSVGYTNNADYTNEAAGQLFTATVSGKLTTLYATVDRFVGGQPLKVSIFTADVTTGVGLPGTLLGAIAIPETQVTGFPPSGTWDLSSLNIDLVAGQSYVVTFTVSTPVYQSTIYRALLTQPNANSFGVRSLYSKDGTTWQQEPPAVNAEIGLIVSVASAPPPQQVVIDVDPSSTANKVNLQSKKLKSLEVAVFGDLSFDVLNVQPASIVLGDPALTDPVTGTGDKVPPASLFYEDVDGDGLLDLLLVFDLATMQSAGAIDQFSQSLEFDGTLDNDGVVYGSDGVTVTGGKTNHKH